MKNSFFKYLLLLFFSAPAFAQDTAVYNCNVQLIIAKPHCDSLRFFNETPKVNYKKMIKRDKKVIAFLNRFHSEKLVLSDLEIDLKKLYPYFVKTKSFSDTSYWKGTLDNKGLIKLSIKYWYKDGHILKRFYDLEINNLPGHMFSRSMEYHYQVFKLLNFCLGKRASCYNFEDEF